MNLIRISKIIFLILLTGSFIYANYFIQNDATLIKIMYSVAIVLIAYIINIFIENIIKKEIKETKQRYSLRKTASTILSIIVFGAILSVWSKDATTLVVAFGLLSAGIAIALQDLLRNVAGGLIIFITKPFIAGDRIQVDNDMGDVLDIKLFYTILMEIREWVDGDQYTGRITQIPNSFVLNKSIKNYTKHFSFIWDEVHIMITYDSNLKKAKEIALEIAHEVADPFKITAANELNDLGEKYLITPSDIDEQIYIIMTDNWVDLRLRYVVDPRQRRVMKRSIFEKLLEAFNREKDVKIASNTYDIVGFPPVKIER